MAASVLKNKIIKKLDSLGDKELKQVNDSLEMFIQSQSDDTEWKDLSPEIKKRVDKSIKQLDQGQFIPYETAIKKIRKKYGLNG